MGEGLILGLTQAASGFAVWKSALLRWVGFFLCTHSLAKQP